MIDAHVHLWKIARGDYGWMSSDLAAIYRDFDIEDLRVRLQSTGVAQAVLVQAAPTVAETEFLLEIAASADEIAGVVGWIDFESPTAADDLSSLCRSPWLKSVRPMIQDIPDPDWMLKPELDAAFRAVIDQDICFDALVLPRHLTQLQTLLARYPDLRVIIDHGAKPLIAEGIIEGWAEDMKAIAGLGSVYCKLSGLVTEAGKDWTEETVRPYANDLLAWFGPERIVWGSDWPVLRLASNYKRWFELAQSYYGGLGESERGAIFGENARRFYRLEH
ncbi:amidohydrolase [Pelagibius sp. Alg239-R121]|uniref:amidohydrolase family protein n=1 Tax=Pelagibius sp. Alg239-R121 TaxID=2993448 RepID=UPI0024A74612|nr:amidohydrolase family protein [Pelagibius sp. Alg239-R121]